MVPTTETTRVHLNKNRQGVATCVYCNAKCTIDMSNYTDRYLGEKSLQVECCTCNKVFHIKFALRRHHRINTSIPGKIFHTCTDEETHDITLLSLSVGGISFIVNNDLDVKNGDIYMIKFQLDDKYTSVICEEITIKRVDGRFVGAEFQHSDRYNHALDFYIVAALWNA
jgi:hypothetical protein